MANMPSENEYGEFTQLRFIRFPPSVMDDFVVQYSAHGKNIPAHQGGKGSCQTTKEAWRYPPGFLFTFLIEERF
jgi:hypothetical protein